MDLVYRSVAQADVSDELAAECARLFSSSYGVWGKGAGPAIAGERARMSTARFRRETMFDKDCFASLALVSDKVVGQALCRSFYHAPLNGNVVWIPQLVVDPLYRRKGIATNLIRRAVIQARSVAAGLVSCHPYAIRALESAANKQVDPVFLMKHARGVICESQVPSVQNREINGFRIQSHFYVDHSEVNAIRDRDPQWKLGSLEDGEETIGIVTTDLVGPHPGREPSSRSCCIYV